MAENKPNQVDVDMMETVLVTLWRELICSMIQMH